MVAANKGAVLASDAWSQLNPEQEHALKRALNDAADGVWVLCIVLHFTKTNQADVVFEDLSSSAVATADAEVTTVHPRGDGAGPVADVQLSIDHRPGPGVLDSVSADLGDPTQAPTARRDSGAAQLPHTSKCIRRARRGRPPVPGPAYRLRAIKQSTDVERPRLQVRSWSGL